MGVELYPWKSSDIGDVLKVTGLSREAIACKLGVSTQSVNNWCLGRTAVNLRHLSDLARILKDAGASDELVQDLVVAQLVRQGIDDNLLNLLIESHNRKVASNRSIMVIGTQLNSTTIQSTLMGFHDVIMALGVKQALYADTWGSQDLLEYYVNIAISTNAKGVAVVGGNRTDQSLEVSLAELSKRGIPCVMVGIPPRILPPGVGMVFIDDYQASAQATEALWSRGHRNMVVLAIERRWGQYKKAEAFCDTLSKLGGTGRVIWGMLSDSKPQLQTISDRPSMREAAQLIADDPDVGAVCALSSYATKYLLLAFRSRGRILGEDVSLIGLGCWDWMHENDPPVTHVAFPHYEAGKRAATVLLSPEREHRQFEPAQIKVPLPDPAIHVSVNGTI
jgi:DNA-binding LacI/PurR family transcriptional regulator